MGTGYLRKITHIFFVLFVIQVNLNLFTIIRDLRTQGIGVIYISHRLDEIFQIADRVTIMRDGQLVVPEGPGMGFRVDEQKIENIRIA